MPIKKERRCFDSLEYTNLDWKVLGESKKFGWPTASAVLVTACIVDV